MMYMICIFYIVLLLTSSLKTPSEYDAPHTPMATRLQRKLTIGYIQDFIGEELNVDKSLVGSVGVMTSGGICPGMNAAIRAVVRVSLSLSSEIIYIRYGLQGLVEGGDKNFIPATLSSTLEIINKGGSFLNSCEGMEFFGRKARLQAAINLLNANLSRLVIIGCEETMRAVLTFHEEWSSLLTELTDREMVSKEVIDNSQPLNIAIIAASITNNVCGTETCLGVDSALHRIIDATDALATSTGAARQAIVVEVMGDKCGYLALTACLSSNGTMAFMPEWPPHGDWKEELKAKIKEDMCNGIESIICLVASGATDKDGKPIKSSDVRDFLVNELKLKTIATVLGQVQRGGNPTAYDRLLAARQGAEAVMALYAREDMQIPCVLGIVGNEIVCASLADVVSRNKMVEDSLRKGEYATAVRLRGRKFQKLLSCYNTLHRLQPSPMLGIPDLRDVPSIAIIRSGRYSIAQCIVTKCIVGYCASKGVRVLGVMNGFDGLLTLNVVHLTWEMVMKWDGHTADCLRSSRTVPAAIGMDKVAAAIRSMGVCGLMLLGSFHAFEALYQMWVAQQQYKELCIPMCFIPVTILNNIPGTDYTIGCDSAVNENVVYCEKMKRVARSQTDTVIVVETMGHMCGYITTIAALCVGAEMAYIRNEPFNFETMLQDVKNVKKKFTNDGMRMTLILHSENANDNYNSEFTHKLFSEEGKDLFVCRHERIGHVQIGVAPSPLDRLAATIQGLMASEWIVDRVEDTMTPDGTVYSTLASDKVVLCQTRQLYFSSIARLSAEADFQQKLPTYMWWQKLRNLMRTLSKREGQGCYEAEAMPFHFQAEDIGESFSECQ